MPNPPMKIDRDALHRVLYRRSDRHHRLRLSCRVLSDELGVSYANFTRVIIEMAAQGRLRRIAGGRMEMKTYVVEDPAVWKDPALAYWTPPPP